MYRNVVGVDALKYNGHHLHNHFWRDMMDAFGVLKRSYFDNEIPLKTEYLGTPMLN